MSESTQSLLGEIDALMRRVVDLSEDLDQARADAVAATTRYDDLRHQIEALAEAWDDPDPERGDPDRADVLRAAIKATP